MLKVKPMRRDSEMDPLKTFSSSVLSLKNLVQGQLWSPPTSSALQRCPTTSCLGPFPAALAMDASDLYLPPSHLFSSNSPNRKHMVHFFTGHICLRVESPPYTQCENFTTDWFHVFIPALCNCVCHTLYLSIACKRYTTLLLFFFKQPNVF